MTKKLSEISGKNIAIGLFGISYQKNYNHWMGWKTNPNWLKTNYKDSLYRLLIENGNNVEHFFSTYHHERELDLLSDLKPKGYRFNDFQDGSWVYQRHCRFKEVLDLFTDCFDYYIVTRFDLSFRIGKLQECNIADNSINVTSKHGFGSDMELQCDFFYVFDNSMFKIFKDFLANLPPDNGDLRYYLMLHKYENSPKFSYMIDGSYYSHNCPVWYLVR